MNLTFLARLFLRRFVLLLSLLFAPLPAAIAASSTAGDGIIEGRVAHAVTGLALENAKVTISPASHPPTVSSTDATGRFRVTGVPSGNVQVSISYFGMEPRTESVALTPGGTLKLTVSLRRDGTADKDDKVVQLDAVNVTAEREMSAQALALNEQRVAANIKNVVALDQYGNQSHESAGEFFHFLPGVAVGNPADSGPNSISLRGFPANFSEVYLDGGKLANARANTRELVMGENVPLVNVSRIEITKVPTPDMPAAGLGGSVNLITKSGFEVAKRTFNYRASTQFHSQNGLTLGWKRSHTGAVSPHVTHPSVDVNYQGPLTDRLAITLGASSTWRLKPANDNIHSVDVIPRWDRVRNVQTNGAWMSLPMLYRTLGGQIGLDWRLTDRDMLSVGGQFKQYSMYITRSILDVNYGAGATGGETFTQGAGTGVGSVSMGGNSGWNENLNKQTQLNLKYEHRGDVWRIQATAAFSEADFRLRDMDNGYFRLIGAQIPNLIIRGDDIFHNGIAQTYTATTRTGGPVDIYDGANYTINTVTSIQDVAKSTNSSARLNVSREFAAVVPFTLKAGLAIDQVEKDRRRYQQLWNFRPNGASDAASRLAGNFDVFDEAFLRDAPKIYGVHYRDISHQKMFELYQRNPSWFVLDEAGAHQNLVTGSNEFTETISAAYLRGDVRLLKDRLWLIGGVRFERTEIEGLGPLNDINAQYRRNADGSFVRDANGNRVLITTDVLALRQLRFQERAATASTAYDDLYPSLNANYNLSDHFVIRAAYARTIGRPNVNFIIPGTTISDPDVVSPTITINNPDLLPWTADNYDLSLESYGLKGGSGSIGLFQKDVKNFFGAVRTPVTDALLEEYGLPTDGSLSGYELSSRQNIGDARITGIEFSYRQSLNFLPGIWKSFQVHFNATKLRREGSRTADFSGFVPKKYTFGLYFIRPRYFVKFNYTNQAEFATGVVAPSATERANTSNYQGEYERMSLDAEYSLSKRYGFFVTASDLGRRTNVTFRYAPETPDYARSTRFMRLGYYVHIGVKGAF